VGRGGGVAHQLLDITAQTHRASLLLTKTRAAQAHEVGGFHTRPAITTHCSTTQHSTAQHSTAHAVLPAFQDPGKLRTRNAGPNTVAQGCCCCCCCLLLSLPHLPLHINQPLLLTPPLLLLHAAASEPCCLGDVTRLVDSCYCLHHCCCCCCCCSRSSPPPRVPLQTLLLPLLLTEPCVSVHAN
jgi:hypothetical protein